MAMTSIERMQAFLQRKPMDRIPVYEHFWNDTHKGWVEKGFVKPEDDFTELFDYDMDEAWAFNLTADLDFVPTVIEENEDTVVMLDGNGAKLRRHKFHDTTPEHVGFTVTARARLVEGPAYDRLPAGEKAKADRVRYLANMFRQADRVVIAAPMWSLSFPGRLKNYLDCILLDGITVSITENKVDGLMNDIPRAFVYVQASGGPFHSLLLMPLNFGNNYMKLIAKTLGFSDYFALPVDGTGSTLQETHAAMDKARKLIPETVDKVTAVR